MNILGKQTKCSNKDCKELENEKFGKQLQTKASDMSKHFVVLCQNLKFDCYIVTAIDSDNNLCVRRLKALFDTVDNKVGKVSVCKNDKKLYPKSFLNIEGMEQLLKLYQMYDMEGSAKVNEEKRKEIEMLQINIKKFCKAQGEDYESEIENTDTNNQVLGKNIKGKLEKIENNVNGVKKRLLNMGNLFQSKGYLNNKNIKKFN